MTKEERMKARQTIALGWARVCEYYLAQAKEALERGVCDFDACSELLDAAHQVMDAADWLPLKVNNDG
jgi:hypothetical protein